MNKTFVLALFLSFSVQASPVFTTTNQNVTVTLYDEECHLKEISNLPRRAVWKEGAKEIEGCWGASQFFPTVIFYFLDKTVFDIPQQLFKRVNGV